MNECMRKRMIRLVSATEKFKFIQLETTEYFSEMLVKFENNQVFQLTANESRKMIIFLEIMSKFTETIFTEVGYFKTHLTRVQNAENSKIEIEKELEKYSEKF